MDVRYGWGSPPPRAVCILFGLCCVTWDMATLAVTTQAPNAANSALTSAGASTRVMPPFFFAFIFSFVQFHFEFICLFIYDFICSFLFDIFIFISFLFSL